MAYGNETGSEMHYENKFSIGDSSEPVKQKNVNLQKQTLYCIQIKT